MIFIRNLYGPNQIADCKPECFRKRAVTISNQEVGCYVSGLDTFHLIINLIDVWSLANQVGKDIKNQLINNQHLQNIKSLVGLLENSTEKKLEQLEPFLSSLSKKEIVLPKVAVTNVGKIDINTDYNKFYLDQLHGGVSGAANYTSKYDIVLSLITFSNTLHLNFHGLSDSHLDLVKDSFIEQLNKIIVPENKKLIFTSLPDEKAIKSKIEHKQQSAINSNDNEDRFDVTPHNSPRLKKS